MPGTVLGPENTKTDKAEPVPSRTGNLDSNPMRLMMCYGCYHRIWTGSNGDESREREACWDEEGWSLVFTGEVSIRQMRGTAEPY